MKITEAGISLIKSYEGIEDGDPTTVNLDPYPCPAGVWTIGWGHAIYFQGRQLSIRNPGDKAIARAQYPGGITINQADQLLRGADIPPREDQVTKLLLHPERINGNEFSALLSFGFNVGIGNFQSSTLLKLVNSGDIAGAADQFCKWVWVKNPHTGIKEKSDGLVRRREAERVLFLT